MENYNLTEESIKKIAIDSLLSSLNDNDKVTNLTTMRHAAMLCDEDQYRYICSFGFVENNFYLRLIFFGSNNFKHKNLFVVGNTDTGNVDVSFLPSISKYDNKNVENVCENLSALDSYYTLFDYDYAEIENKVNLFANMLKETLPIQRKRIK